MFWKEKKMKFALPLKMAAIGAIGFSTVFAAANVTVSRHGSIARAQSIFGQEEVDQSAFAAVASPFGTSLYSLVIVEQIPGRQQCWSEAGTSPVRIDPLWRTFDFTGSCRRSVDSNGYSIRINGEDFGIEYLLRIINRDGDLHLVGTPRVGSSRAGLNEITIARSRGTFSGPHGEILYKFFLEPGWRFTKRTFEGRTLGHVYLTNDGAPTPAPTPSPSPSPSPSPAPNPTSSFPDISNDIYRAEIEEALRVGFIAGFPEDNTFRPLNTLTREQLVAMVFGAVQTVPDINLPTPSTPSSNPFPDVPASRWSAARIQWARANNIVSGYPDGQFRPTQAVTRAELMAVMKKMAEYGKARRGFSTTLGQKQTPTTFSDTAGHWANSLIQQMSGYCGVASALSERGTAFAPNSSALRNYAAAATLRSLNCVKADS